ncbi:hypothetical protein C8R46DRAFT_1118238 [Mycena filopes]|nr:hypothetical protein C8R46DRAFT_1118238 [Mycena filopes]
MKCQRAASVEPTATLCGHVFCKSCVELAVMKTKACPKCAAATLLYCLLPLHLDD